MSENVIYTIGHGNRPLKELVEAVLSYDIDYLIDVRSTPYSRYCPQFARESVREAINSSGRTRYAYLGDHLGGYPPEEEFYIDGKIDYQKYSQCERFQRGISRLKTACQEKGLKLCIMCSESDPTNCHRTRLISNELEKVGVPVRHIVFFPDGERVNQSSDVNTTPSAAIEDDSYSDGIECSEATADYDKDKVRTTLLTQAQVLSGCYRRLKTSGNLPERDGYPAEGLFS